MAITSIKTGSSFTNLVKYNDFLAGNPSFIPSSYESIASLTPSSYGTYEFTSIPSTYASLQLRISSLDASANNTWIMTFNNSGGTNYAYHTLSGNGTTAAATGYANQAGIDVNTGGSGTSSTQPTVAIIDIHDYASTTNYKTARIFCGTDKNGTGGAVNLNSGVWKSTSAITTLTLAGGSFSSGTTLALYGIKGA